MSRLFGKTRVLVMEGLGNQLFQYAFAHHVGLKYQTPIQLVRPFKPWRIEDRPFELQGLLQTCNHLDVSRDKRFRFQRVLERGNAFVALRLSLSIPMIRMRFWDSDLPKFKSAWIRHSTFTGFFQQSEFLSSAIETVVSEINIHLREYPRIFSHPYIAIHVRRGDFDSHKFGWLNQKYYLDILEEIQDNFPIIVVTDSPEEAARLFSALNISQILGPRDLSAWQTLAVMADAAYLIGANSTLSFWGSILNASRQGNAFMPEIWMKGDCRIVPIWDRFSFQIRPAFWI